MGTINKRNEVRGHNDTPRALLELDADCTLGRLAGGTGITAVHLSRIFRGIRGASLPAAARIAAYLGVSIDRVHAALSRAQRGAGLAATKEHAVGKGSHKGQEGWAGKPKQVKKSKRHVVNARRGQEGRDAATTAEEGEGVRQ